MVLLLLLATGAGIFFAQQKDGKKYGWIQTAGDPGREKTGYPNSEEQSKAKAAGQGEKSQKETKKSYGKITGTDVRLRTGAGTNTDIVDYFEEGETVEITGRKNNWYQVKRDNGQNRVRFSPVPGVCNQVQEGRDHGEDLPKTEMEGTGLGGLFSPGPGAGSGIYCQRLPEWSEAGTGSCTPG